MSTFTSSLSQTPPPCSKLAHEPILFLLKPYASPSAIEQEAKVKNLLEIWIKFPYEWKAKGEYVILNLEILCFYDFLIVIKKHFQNAFHLKVCLQVSKMIVSQISLGRKLRNGCFCPMRRAAGEGECTQDKCKGMDKETRVKCLSWGAEVIKGTSAMGEHLVWCEPHP